MQDTSKILLAKYELKTLTNELKTLTNELIQCYSKVGWKSTKTNNQTENFVSLKRIIRLSFIIRKGIIYTLWYYLRDASTKTQTFKKLMESQCCYKGLDCFWAFRSTKRDANNYGMHHNSQLQNLYTKFCPNLFKF